jgi:D-amino-acid dehydrogenase
VLLIDREGVAAQASCGNAGALAFSDIMPPPRRESLRKAPRWLLDPLGPLAIRPSYVFNLAPWLWRFWRASRPDRAREHRGAGGIDGPGRGNATNARRAGAGHMVHSDGVLHVYESEDELRASEPGWQARAEYGTRSNICMVREATAAPAGSKLRRGRATFVPRWHTVSDPWRLDRKRWRTRSSSAVVARARGGAAPRARHRRRARASP